MKDIFHQTILDIYSAPGDSQLWNNALKSINNLIGGKATAYVLINNHDGYADISHSWGYSAEILSNYSGPGGAAIDDVRYKYLHNLLPGQVFRDMEFVESREDWDAASWNRFERETMGIYYCLSAQISTHGVWSDYISVNRLESDGPNTDQEKSDLQVLLPHLARAAELQRMISGLEERYGAVLSVLDNLLVGLVILDKQGRIVTSNSTAGEISLSSGAFSMSNGRLKIFENETNSELQELLKQTGVTANDGGTADGGQIAVKNRSNEGELLLEVMPLRDDGFSDNDNIRGSAIFIIDPEKANSLSCRGIREIFNLTLSESNVVESIVNGMSVGQIAEQRNTSVDTVRRQLKTAYAKTGTNGQLDLLRKVVMANPPIK